MERIFNCTPSRRTDRDFPMLMEAGQELPYKYKPNEIEDLLNRIRYDQLSSSSCVGQALAKLKSISQYRDKIGTKSTKKGGRALFWCVPFGV